MKKIKDKGKMIKIGAVIGTVGVIGGIISTICMRRKIRKIDERIQEPPIYTKLRPCCSERDAAVSGTKFTGGAS